MPDRVNMHKLGHALSMVPGAFSSTRKKDWEFRRRQVIIRQELDTLPEVMEQIDIARKNLIRYEGCTHRRPVAEEFYVSQLAKVQSILRKGMKKDMLEPFMVMLIDKYVADIRRLVGIIDGTYLLEKYEQDERVVGCRSLCITVLALKMDTDYEESVRSYASSRQSRPQRNNSYLMLQDRDAPGAGYPMPMMLEDSHRQIRPGSSFHMIEDAPHRDQSFGFCNQTSHIDDDYADTGTETEGMHKFGRWNVYVVPGNARVFGRFGASNRGTSEVMTKSAAPGSVSQAASLSVDLTHRTVKKRDKGFMMEPEVATFSTELVDLVKTANHLSEFSCISEFPDSDRILPLAPGWEQDLEFLPLLKASVPQVQAAPGARYTVQMRRAHPAQKFGVRFSQDNFGVFVSEDCPMLEMLKGDRLLRINGLPPITHVSRCLDKARSLLLLLKRGTGFYDGDNPVRGQEQVDEEAAECGCCDQQLDAGTAAPGPWMTLLSVTKPLIVSAQRGEFEFYIERVSKDQSFGLSLDVTETAKSRSVVVSESALQFGCWEGDTLVYVNGTRAKGGAAVQRLLEENNEVCLRLARHPPLSLMELRFELAPIAADDRDLYEAGTGFEEFTYGRPTRSSWCCCG